MHQQQRHGNLTGGRSFRRRMQMPSVAAADRSPIGRVSPVFFTTRLMQNERDRTGTDADWPVGRRDFSD